MDSQLRTQYADLVLDFFLPLGKRTVSRAPSKGSNRMDAV